jgi:maltose alpha-D-glucosyltransferase/alpha-amylase
MQWSSDRNAGFSRANPQQLYLPVILDPIYGYQSVNVESQNSDASSLLNWTRRMIAVRKQHQAFGRGDMRLLYPSNRKVFAYLRAWEGESILCVGNLSRAAQAAELDLSEFSGRVPVELTSNSAFPPVGDLPYLITLPAYGFYWFLLADEAAAPDWHTPMPEVMPEFITLTTRDGAVSTALRGREGRMLETEILPSFLPLQRWFGAKDRQITSISVKPLAELEQGRLALAIVEVDTDERQRYFLPLSALWGEENLIFGAPKLAYTVGKIRRGPRVGALIDGTADEEFAERMLDDMRRGDSLEADGGTIVFKGNDLLRAIVDPGEPRPLAVEQSNVSVAFGNSLIIKFYKRLRSGVQPDVEMSRFLTEQADFANTPAYLGSVALESEGETTTLAAAFGFVENMGDVWKVLTDALRRDLEENEIGHSAGDGVPHGDEQPFYFPLAIGELLGRRTAELHVALATQTDDPDFASEPITADDVRGWTEEATSDLDAMLDRLEAAGVTLPEEAGEMAQAIFEAREDLYERLRAATRMQPSGRRSRIHGDYHLGQLLMAKNDVVIIDFEGEPRRSLEQRRAKSSPLRDVAGMVRSIDYAAWSALEHYDTGNESAEERASDRAWAWRDGTLRDFLSAYEKTIASSNVYPEDEDFAKALLDLFLIQKAAYEVGYELANRPAWVGIPLRGLLSITETGKDER